MTNTLIERSKHNEPQPLGAWWGGSGTHFAIYSGVARQVELCLFDSDGGRESRIGMSADANAVWHAYVSGSGPGQQYGFRVDGPYAPVEGLRCNSAKLLLDPYVKAVTGLIPVDDVLLGYDVLKPDLPDMRDSAGVMPKGVVIDERFDWGEDRHPHTPLSDTVIYECHVKGMTKLHPLVDPHLRGTYLGLSSPPIIEHLLSLGVTAVELLPMQYFVTERRLAQMGLVNYWGYNTIGFFAPDVRYATSPERAVEEFKAMVRAFHQSGIEVILDVVYNHTAEGDERGPTLSFRGIDNRAYYQLEAGAPGRYVNHTACGNTINARHPRTQKLIMDSLRYWVEQMHVDGFRFDLAPALCRGPHGVDESFRFFSEILNDPVLREAKLLVEPWDAGPGGFWLGRFPAGIGEWNGRYRDCVRRFWRGDQGQLAEFASRLAGSSDVFAKERGPLASVNYVTCHDGSTLQDVVSYERKHNEANGEENRDGPPNDFSRNYGTEGPSHNPETNTFRERMKRNFLATLALSQGVPMLTAGDEIGRTQRGNDNAYCQDTEISWVDWNLDSAKKEMLEFTRQALAIRKVYSALRRDTFFVGRLDCGLQDVVWLDETGRELSERQWRDPERRFFGMRIHGLNHPPRRAGFGHEGHEERIDLLLLVNACEELRTFALPIGISWQELFNTFGATEGARHESEVALMSRSLMLLSSQG